VAELVRRGAQQKLTATFDRLRVHGDECRVGQALRIELANPQNRVAIVVRDRTDGRPLQPIRDAVHPK
jgi:hypothetical protein